MPALISLLYGVAAAFGAAFAVIELRMLYRFLSNRADIRAGASAYDQEASGADPAQEDVRPTVTVQIPLYNERTSAEQIVRAAAAQDYPRDRFDIQVLDDSTDETSEIVAALVEEVRVDGVRIEHIRRRHRTGYKAGALSEGLERSDARFVALFDADFVPEPGFLRTLLVDDRPFDDPTVAFVQARWSWARGFDRLLPSALSLLLDRHFAIQKPTQEFVGNVTTFNGSAGIWRRAAIDDAGGWTADTLTEDLDLSYRCALRGWHGRYVQTVHVPNELPEHMRAFKLQQRRWAKGNAQCFRKLTGRVLGSRSVVRDRLDEAFVLAGYAIHPLLLLSLVLWPWAVLYVDRTLFWILQALMSLGMIAALLSFLVTVQERDRRLSLRSVGEVLFGMGVGMGLMVNNTVGQIQGFFQSGGEFLRTPKGTARASGGADSPAAPGPRAGVVDASLTTAGAPGARAAAAPAVGAATSRAADARAAVAGATRVRPKAYASPLDWTFFAEILVMAYCAFGAAFLIQSGEAFWSVPMFMWALCMGLMVQQQMLLPRPAEA
jgi:cellulose synthase/poly-beta-1,6-N-acetylglucosamine synthase-like glycosyltransferase